MSRTANYLLGVLLLFLTIAVFGSVYLIGFPLLLEAGNDPDLNTQIAVQDVEPTEQATATPTLAAPTTTVATVAVQESLAATATATATPTATAASPITVTAPPEAVIVDAPGDPPTIAPAPTDVPPPTEDPNQQPTPLPVATDLPTAQPSPLPTVRVQQIAPTATKWPTAVPPTATRQSQGAWPTATPGWRNPTATATWRAPTATPSWRNPTATPVPNQAQQSAAPSSATNAIAWWQIESGSHAANGNNTWRVNLIVRVPTSFNYSFDMPFMTQIRERSHNLEGDDIYVVSLSGMQCGKKLATDLVARQNGARMLVYNEFSVVAGPITIDAAC